MTDPAIIETAARVLARYPSWEWESMNADAHQSSIDLHRDTAAAVLAAVTPMIEAAALERAAKVVEEWLSHGTMQLRAGEMTAQELRTAKAIASAIHDGIRALKEQP